MKTAWLCDACKTFGTVQHERSADVWTVYQRVAAAHRRKFSKGRTCPDALMLRVWVPQGALTRLKGGA